MIQTIKVVQMSKRQTKSSDVPSYTKPSVPFVDTQIPVFPVPNFEQWLEDDKLRMTRNSDLMREEKTVRKAEEAKKKLEKNNSNK
jgi:hypothetical protein